MGTGSVELLEIQRAAEFGNIVWFSSLALVLDPGTTDYLGYPSAFLYSWLCAGAKKVSHLSNGSDLDSVSIQVISLKYNYNLSLVVFFSSKLMSSLQQSMVFRLNDRKSKTIRILEKRQSITQQSLELKVILPFISLAYTCLVRP